MNPENTKNPIIAKYRENIENIEEKAGRGKVGRTATLKGQRQYR